MVGPGPVRKARVWGALQSPHPVSEAPAAAASPDGLVPAPVALGCASQIEK